MREFLMTLRDALGLRPPEPPRMSPEQVLVADRQRRIAARQQAIDIQVQVLQAESRAKRRHE